MEANDEPDKLQNILRGFNSNSSGSCPDYENLRSTWDAVWRRVLWERLYTPEAEWTKDVNYTQKLNENVTTIDLHVRPQFSWTNLDHQRVLSSDDWKLFHNQLRNSCIGQKETTLLCCVEHKKDHQDQQRFSCFQETHRSYNQHAELNALDRLKLFDRQKITRVSLYICWSPCDNCCQQIITYVHQAGFGKHNFSVKVGSVYYHNITSIVTKLRELSNTVKLSVFTKNDWIYLGDHLNCNAYEYLRKNDETSRAETVEAILAAPGGTTTSCSETDENTTKEDGVKVEEVDGIEVDEKENQEFIHDRKKIKLGTSEDDMQAARHKMTGNPESQIRDTVAKAAPNWKELRQKWDAEWRKVFSDRMKNNFNGWSWISVKTRLNAGIEEKQSFHVCPDGAPAQKITSGHQPVLSSAGWKLFHNQLRRNAEEDRTTTVILCCVEMRDKTQFCFEENDTSLKPTIQRLKCFEKLQISKVDIYVSRSPKPNCSNQIIEFARSKEFAFSVKFSSIYLDYNRDVMKKIKDLGQTVSVSVFNDDDWTHLENHLSTDACIALKNEVEEKRKYRFGGASVHGDATSERIPATPVKSTENMPSTSSAMTFATPTRGLAESMGKLATSTPARKLPF